jgi:hypothetical protein
MAEHDDVRGALAQLLADAPPMRLTVGDHVRHGHTLRARRRGRIASAAAGVLAVAAVAVIALPHWGGSRPGVSAAESPSAPAPALATSNWAPGQPAELALSQGTLVLTTDGCVALGGRSGTSEPLAWPQGYTARPAGDGVVDVVAPDGTVVAHTGERVHLGGGSIGLKGLPPSRCLPTSDSVFAIQEDLTHTDPSGAPILGS